VWTYEGRHEPPFRCVSLAQSSSAITLIATKPALRSARLVPYVDCGETLTLPRHDPGFVAPYTHAPAPNETAAELPRRLIES
jgi:hypothetical protein